MESGAMTSGATLADDYRMRFAFRLYRECVSVLRLGSCVLSRRMMPESSDALEVDCVTEVMKKLVTTALAGRPVIMVITSATAAVAGGAGGWSRNRPSPPACSIVPGMELPGNAKTVPPLEGHMAMPEYPPNPATTPPARVSTRAAVEAPSTADSRSTSVEASLASTAG